MLYAGVLLFLMLQFLRPQEFLPFMHGWRVVLITMIALIPPWIATLQGKKLLRTPHDLFLFAFWIMCCLSYLNYWPSHMLHDDGPVIGFGKTVICYLFVAHAIDTRRKLMGSIWTVMLMLLLIALMAETVEQGPTQGQYASIGMFNNRNDFAYAIALMLPIGAAFMWRGDPFAKIVGAGVVLAGVVEIVKTGSRGGGLAALFAVYATLYVLVKSKPGRAVMMGVGLIGLTFTFWLSPRLASVGQYQGDRSAMGRVEIWSQCLRLAKQHPIIGWGMRRWDKHDFPEKVKKDTHNSYMRALVELGYVGLFVYLGLLYFCLRDALRLARDAPHPSIRVAALAMTGVLAGQIVGSLFQTRLYHAFVIVLFGVCSSLRLVADREETELKAMDAGAAAAGDPAELPGLWERSLGAGFMSRGLLTKKEFYRIVALTALCWVVHKLFIMRSFR